MKKQRTLAQPSHSKVQQEPGSVAEGRRRPPAGQGRGRDSGSGGRRVQESPDLRPRSYPSFGRPFILHIAPPIEVPLLFARRRSSKLKDPDLAAYLKEVCQL
jgi:hypothetical protein